MLFPVFFLCLYRLFIRRLQQFCVWPQWKMRISWNSVKSWRLSRLSDKSLVFLCYFFYVTVPLLIWLNFVTGQFQWQVWWAQEEMGRWDHGLQITGQNQSKGETAFQGSFPEDELAYDTTQRFWVLSVEQYYFPIFCFPWLDFIWAVHCNEWMIFLPSGHL